MLLSMLLVLFVGLKLAHVIDWSWWWVFAPIIVEALRWVSREALREGIKQKQPWAIKLALWLKS